VVAIDIVGRCLIRTSALGMRSPIGPGQDDRSRGKGIALAGALASLSARRVGGGEKAKGIVSVDDRPRVNAAT
jgi:hypothetical protein